MLAVTLAVLLQGEIWLGERYQGGLAFPGARAVTAPLMLIAALALAWRRVAPTVTLAVVMGMVALQSLLAGGSEAAGSFALFLIATYSAAAYGSHLLLSAALAVAGLVVHDLKDPYIHGVGDALFAFLFVAVGLVLGRALHGRGARARVLAEEARRLRVERDEHARQAVAEERSRIALELHDIVAHSVSVMVVQALAGQRALDGEEPAARESFSAIERTGRQAMAEMRRLLSILREDHVVSSEPQPGVERLPELIEASRCAGLDVELDEQGDPPSVSPGVGLAIYRIVQEALTNSLKHAGQTHAHVTVSYANAHVDLAVRDSGPPAGGRLVHDFGSGHGIPGMRERAAVFGGELQAAPTEDGGFVLSARLPLEDGRP